MQEIFAFQVVLSTKNGEKGALINIFWQIMFQEAYKSGITFAVYLFVVQYHDF